MSRQCFAFVGEHALRPSVDTHAHVFLERLPMVAGRRYTPDYDATPVAFAALRANAAVPRAVLVQPSFLGFDNSYMAEVLRADPATLRGVAVLAPDVSDAAINELHGSGVRGIRFNLKGQDPAMPLDRDQTRLAERVGARGWHIEVYADCERLPKLLDHWTARGLAVVVDHLGCPAAEGTGTDAGLEDLITRAQSRSERVYVKLSGPYRQRCNADRVARQLIERVPGDRLLWGSDWPWTQNEGRFAYSDTVGWLLRWTEGAPDIIADMNGAAERLYDF